MAAERPIQITRQPPSPWKKSTPQRATIVGEMVLPQRFDKLGGVTENAISGEYGSSSEGSALAGNGQSLVIAGYGVNAATYNSGGAAVYGNAALAQSTSFKADEYTAVPASSRISAITARSIPAPRSITSSTPTTRAVSPPSTAKPSTSPARA